jgi:xanthine dehydrogenase small subunit
VQGKPWTQAVLASIEAAAARDFSPITDHRGGASYRLRAAANLVRRFQWETASRVPARLEAL